ncbi:hypothetical protein RB653_006498 [Dictyostelium firmibasis]|uniref:HORMA domain-containing protein n=1 Tax=Dictyostelium firmibasis TaxID=79012 RepID=A0AAN7UEM2_9MYCE
MVDEHFCDCVGEFLETSFHCILYIRGVYPSCLFSKSIKYDIPVPISRSDLLSRYISNSIDSLKPHFIRDTIEKVSLTILNKHDKPIEKFIFEFSTFNNKNYDDINNNNNNNNNNEGETSNYYFNIHKSNFLSNNQNQNNNYLNKPNLPQLEASFKAYILKILMTTDSFYDDQNFYKTQSSSFSNNSDDYDRFISNSDGVIHFNEKDDKTYKQKGTKEKNQKEDDDKDLKFTIHVYTKPIHSNVGLNTNLSNVILNINPLESPRRTNTTMNQITPVWVPTTEKESEIENSFVIPLNSNISDGKTTLRTFTEQSIAK